MLPLLMTGNNIKPGDKFFDGQFLFVAERDGNSDDMIMKGMDITGHQLNYGLMKGKQSGEYSLAQIDASDPMPYGCVWGSRVQYVRKDGMNFLEFYPEEHSVGQTAVLTPDNIVDCSALQTDAENKDDVIWMCHNWLMNQHYVKQIPGERLQDMLNALQAVRKPGIIESTNQQIIAYEQAMRFSDTMPGDIIAEEKEIVVCTAEDFLAALGSNRIITLEPGTYLNLSEVLNFESHFSDNRHLWLSEEDHKNGTDIVASLECHDGRQLALIGISNLTIRGTEDCCIVVEPRYANVLNLINCEQITIDNLTLGHTEEGFCQGGVICTDGSITTIISGCDLYGCGIYGIQAYNSNGLYVRNTMIRDCSYGILELYGTQDAIFTDCDFIRCREYTLVSVDSRCNGTVFNGCRFAQNRGALFRLASPIEVSGCEIHHPNGEELGDVNSTMFVFGDDNTRWYRDNDPLTKRNVGPQISK